MSKVQDYLEKKRIAALGYPTMYIVYSNPKLVNKPIIATISNIERNAGKVTTYGIGDNAKKEEYSYDTYTLVDVFPPKIDIRQGKVSASEMGYGSGQGDLWCWTYYCTIDKDDAEAYYVEELKRVSDNYINKGKIMSKDVLIISSPDGDWEGLYIDGILIDEGHKLGGGNHPCEYWLDKSEKYEFKSADVRIKYVQDDSEDAEYLDSVGSFPNELKYLKGKY